MAANANADAAQLPDPANAAGRASENSSVSDAPVGTDIHLTLLMVSSARASLTFKPEDTVLSVKETLLRSWPKDFDAKPAGPGNLRIVYLGHFLEDGDTLAACLCAAQTAYSERAEQ
ncbi:hypothetical protein FBU59_004282 [Linderina macrospora]|uniref:Uncharacterized protein n=1 Tax=Linderina macrospora TaxID=4868 RepID=A0ACC1J5U5_9FUNG|nr:hypothetical protein FBU59_004282 [Linderina macrospora]